MADKFCVIVRADGTIPFDEDVPAANRQVMLEAVKAAGHVVEYDPAGNRFFIPGWAERAK